MVLLRLVKVPCPEPLLNLWLEVDIDYVNSLISLATRHTGPLDSFVLDTVLDPDRWTLSFEVLGTSHDLLYSSWTTVFCSIHAKCSTGLNPLLMKYTLELPVSKKLWKMGKQCLKF